MDDIVQKALDCSLFRVLEQLAPHSWRPDIKTTRNQTSIFGKLLSSYRYVRGITLTDLQGLLEIDHGFPISVSTMSKYELGLRTPPPDFIYYAVQSLQLTEEEEASLLQACTDDFAWKLRKEYDQLKTVQQEATSAAQLSDNQT